jgi:pyruvate ferredoxin oxidoreductase delta subunit
MGISKKQQVMNRPTITKYNRPEHIRDYPTGTNYPAGHLVDKNAGWRTFRPVIDKETCVNCLVCYLICPDGVIFKSEDKVDIDYDFCKGCGVCANECKVGAIKMEKEVK